MSDNQTAPQAGGTDMGLITYICFAAGIVTGGLGAIVGVIIAYVDSENVRGTWKESHYQWLIRTFWIGLAPYIIGGILALILIGWLILIPLFIWYIVRLVKG